MSDETNVPVAEVRDVLPVEVQPEATATEPEVTNEPAQPEEQKEDHKENRIQKRIDKLTREKYELKGRLDALESMMRQPQQQAQEVTDKPAREQFGSDLDYLEAVQDWKLEKREQAASQTKTQERQSNIEKVWQERETQAAKEYQDYSDVIEDAQDVKINNAAVDAILESELGPDIRYYLAKNPAEAEKTLTMSPARAIAFIGKIEARLEADKAKRASVPKVSKAPVPIRPVSSGGGGNAHFDINDPKTNMSDWMKQRNAQLKQA